MNIPTSTSSASPSTNASAPASPALTPEQEDCAKRLGTVAGLIALSKACPDKLRTAPKWLMTCVSHVAEASAQDAGEVVENMLSPFGIGMSLGNISVMVNLVKRPSDHWDGNSMNQFLNVYFQTYTRYVAQALGQEIPADKLFVGFTEGVFGVFIGSDYEQRREFIRGMTVALDAERNFREDTLRETSATRIYIEILLYAPEIMKMKNLTDVYQFLQGRFAENPNLLGDPERFRKLANRIELSFREQVS